jgi:UDP-N-acetylglucosamine--N-acetylmuramyl-(pentapeptide) pyrophosphoryl-undecaprenol N-acetylglucosamine transferase
VIAAGGTAGHVVPALAVAEALRADGAQVAFIGGARAEAQLVPEAGFELRAISAEGLSRTSPARALAALARALAGAWRSRRILGELAPDVVMGAGGYVAGPVVVAALTRRVPVLLTEADSRLGITNRLLAPFAARVCLAFEPRERRRSGKFRVTGRPIPEVPRERVRARERLGLSESESFVLVFGGSLGARSINEAAIGGLASSAARVLHVCGRRDYPKLATRVLRDGYELREYLPVTDFTDALAAADLAVARAGGSIFELAACGVPAILVPYPHAAGDHQRENARWMSDARAAVTIDDRELTAQRLQREVGELLGDRERLAAMASSSLALARPHAARDVAHELLELARR